MFSSIYLIAGEILKEFLPEGKEYVSKFDGKIESIERNITKFESSIKYKVDKNEFFNMVESGELFESTMYAGHGFGSKKSDVDDILHNGRRVLAIMDICGAMSLKTHYKDVVTVYVKRDKRELLSSILEKNSTNEDKVNRIISIDDERRNEEICDYVVENFGDYDKVSEKIIEMLF